MGAVFKTVVRARERTQVGSTPTRLRHFDFGLGILDFGLKTRGGLKSKEATRMTEQEFKQRTKNVALRIIKLVESLPKVRSADVIGKQLLRSGTSVGANYRAAYRAKSIADIINKLSIVEEEADESMFWIELLIESGIVPSKKLTALYDDINEIVAMTVASIKTMKIKKSANPKSKI